MENQKKLSLDGRKKEILADCLQKAAGCLDADMGRIYLGMIRECGTHADRLLLNGAQAESAKWALSRFGKGTSEAEQMIDQIAMTRAQYQEKYGEGKQKRYAAVIRQEAVRDAQICIQQECDDSDDYAWENKDRAEIFIGIVGSAKEAAEMAGIHWSNVRLIEI